MLQENRVEKIPKEVQESLKKWIEDLYGRDEEYMNLNEHILTRWEKLNSHVMIILEKLVRDFSYKIVIGNKDE